LATNAWVTAAAASEAAHIGFKPVVARGKLRGEARHAGRRVARRLQKAKRPACLVLGGETTVTVRGRGRGGRNQELALAAAGTLDSQPRVALMALATDGVDGPTDAAGALVTGDTLRRLRARGVDPEASLATNSSYDALRAADALIRTGPTGTNLNDLVVALAYER
jgi:hydroxypyruvate reductase